MCRAEQYEQSSSSSREEDGKALEGKDGRRIKQIKMIKKKRGRQKKKKKKRKRKITREINQCPFLMVPCRTSIAAAAEPFE